MACLGWMMMSQPATATQAPAIAEAIFAGGCFWCIEAELDELEGVESAISGYIGGEADTPSYEEVTTGNTGHAEAVLVRYHAEKITYEQLLEIFWSNIDPTDAGGQFYDRGSQYRTAIFYLNDEQKRLAEASKAEKTKMLGKPIVTEIVPASTFYPAEDYHQNYYQKNPLRYNAYKLGSGRKTTLEKIWDNK